MINRKPNPTNCKLAKIDVKQAKTAIKTVEKPVMASDDIRRATLTLFDGKTTGVLGYDAWNQLSTQDKTIFSSSDNFVEVYRKLGGQWGTQVHEEAGKAIYSATIKCRLRDELLAETGPEGAVWYNSSQFATDALTKLARGRTGKNLCATCPYKGMDPAEADIYDSRANRAEAERVRSELVLDIARRELEDHLKVLGIDTTNSETNTSTPQ